MTVFDRIYRTNAWAGKESRSGPGSGTEATMVIAQEIRALVMEYEIKSVLNAACGDDFWTPDLPGYLGIDISQEAIKRARRNHPDRRYEVGDVCWMLLAPFDLIIFRDAMQHMRQIDGIAALEAIRHSQSRWLLASTFVDAENEDIVTGHAYSPNLEAEPYGWGQPERLIFDGYGYEDGTAIRDPRKHLGLWRL